ncbi:calcium-activated chloride channel regulator 4-like, partial [Anneissia japonica]|uniref:calcium-activated chloride channel regulator 4-like n=1 Tax=Anneissia japonica TaxID=1529436 RepID=UPI0014255B21
AGRWSFIISNELPFYQSQVVSVIVESKQASIDDIPITITSFVNEPFIDYQTSPAPHVIVFAIVNKGNEFVANADVIAILDRPNAPDEVFELYDSGTNADILKNDGIYSGYFFNFTDNGRYSVEVKVKGKEDTASIGFVENSRSFPIQGEEETIMKLVGMFERSASGGVLQVSNHVDVAIDRLQPSRIIDLKVIEVSYQQQSVTLQWTAVGDDFDKGS